MSRILKHSFEAVSLLTAENGMLEVTVVPAMNQPDWVIPTSLILSVDAHDERIWTYLWQSQDVAVFHLLPRDEVPDKLVVLEGNTAVHRIALQTAGDLRHLKVRISDVQDSELPEHYLKQMHDNDTDAAQEESTTEEIPFGEDVITSYMYQTVTIDNTPYLVPDLDKIAHQLVDLDN